MSWSDITAEVGYANGPNAVRAVKAYSGMLPTPTCDELRQLMRARSELVLQQAFPDVLGQRPGVVRAAVAVMQWQTQLDGLDARQRATVDFDSPDVHSQLGPIRASCGVRRAGRCRTCGSSDSHARAGVKRPRSRATASE
jgi:hypothetical protein